MGGGGVGGADEAESCSVSLSLFGCVIILDFFPRFLCLFVSFFSCFLCFFIFFLCFICFSVSPLSLFLFFVCFYSLFLSFLCFTQTWLRSDFFF